MVCHLPSLCVVLAEYYYRLSYILLCNILSGCTTTTHTEIVDLEWVADGAGMYRCITKNDFTLLRLAVNERGSRIVEYYETEVCGIRKVAIARHETAGRTRRTIILRLDFRRMRY